MMLKQQPETKKKGRRYRRPKKSLGEDACKGMFVMRYIKNCASAKKTTRLAKTAINDMPGTSI
jgi:hypothetical protein